MRLFTAIDLSAEVRENLRLALARMNTAAKVRWSPLENLHITMKFIGEWPEGRLEEMTRAIEAISLFGAVGISIRGLSWFNTTHSSIFLAHVHSGEALKRSAEAVQDAVAKLGIRREERPFTPHVTLARVKDRSQAASIREAAASLGNADFGSFEALEYFLYRSAGGRYTKLASFPLTRPVTQS